MDYEALAKQYGGSVAAAPAKAATPTSAPVDYAAMAQSMGGSVEEPKAEAPAKTSSFLDDVKRSPLVRAGIGAYRGAQDVTDNLVRAGAYIADKISPTAGGAPSRGDQAKADIDAQRAKFEAEFGNSTFAKVGRVGGNIAATIPAGPVIGAAAKAVSVGAGAMTGGAATISPAILSALRTAGFTTGVQAQGVRAIAQDLATRSIAGGVVGAASAAAVNPDDALSGGVIGAALPPGLKAVGAAGRAAAGAFKTAGIGGDATASQLQKILLGKELDATTSAERRVLIDQLRGANVYVDGSTPTVAQALMTPEASILQRVVYDSPGGKTLRDQTVKNSQARMAQAEGVAPINVDGSAQARVDFGSAVERYARPEEARISRRVSDLYRGVDENGVERIPMPVEQMQGAMDKYMGRGTVIDNAAPGKMVDMAKTLSTPEAAGGAPKLLYPTGEPIFVNPPQQQTAATWQEAGSLRASINKASRDASIAGDKQAKAALDGQKAALDDAIKGNLSVEALAKWQEANSSHIAKMDRFHSGPQASIFKQGRDGMPAKQGAEVTGAFWSGKDSLKEDVQGFRKLVDDNPALMGQFKSMVNTEGVATADKANNLTTKFSKWVDQKLPGLREVFTPDETATLQRIASDIDREYKAVRMGTSLGGSNTYQNSANALSLGLLDGKLPSAAAKIPGLSWAIDGTRNYLKNNKAENFAELLANSNKAANAIEKIGSTSSKGGLLQALQNAKLQQLRYRAVPVINSPNQAP